MLVASNIHMTDKQIIDRNITELKHISRDFDIPVIGVSSFNRENYNTSINLASFKESGAIEYSSDVLMVLQYDFMSVESGETSSKRQERLEKAKLENLLKSREGKPISIELKVLKNRNGAKGSTSFKFWEKFNCFDNKISNKN